jgi:hypothetical protein
MRHIPYQASRDKKGLGDASISSHESNTAPDSKSTNPTIKFLYIFTLKGNGNSKGKKQIRGGASHSCYVAHVDGESLVAKSVKGCPLQIKMDSFD